MISGRRASDHNWQSPDQGRRRRAHAGHGAVIAERPPLPVARVRVVKELEQRYIAALLAEHGTVARATAASGIARRYFQLLRGGKRREA